MTSLSVIDVLRVFVYHLVTFASIAKVGNFKKVSLRGRANDEVHFEVENLPRKRQVPQLADFTPVYTFCPGNTTLRDREIDVMFSYAS